MLASASCGAGRCRSKVARTRARASCAVSWPPSKAARPRRPKRPASNMFGGRRRQQRQVFSRSIEETRMTKMVTFNRPDGNSVEGYLAEPAAGGNAPAMVVIQEWWGLDAEIKGV